MYTKTVRVYKMFAPYMDDGSEVVSSCSEQILDVLIGTIIFDGTVCFRRADRLAEPTS